MTLSIFIEHYPIRGNFTIARGTKTQAEVILCQISHKDKIGRGECVPYARYGESSQSVIAQIETIRPLIDFNRSSLNQIHSDILAALPAGAARNALDCALWDLAAKLTGFPVAQQLNLKPQTLTTAYTLSLASPQAMGHQAKKHAHLPLLKIKVGTDGFETDIARMRSVRENAPSTTLIVDANEGWNEKNLVFCMEAAHACGVAMIEQPLPASQDDILAHIPHAVAVYADESCHISADLDCLKGTYDGVNIKLDKTGGLSEALKLKQQARQMGFGIMVGSMVATSLSMAPAVLLAQDADFVDLDGPLLLNEDRQDGLFYQQTRLFPPSVTLWG